VLHNVQAVQSLKTRSKKGDMKLPAKNIVRRYELTYLLPVSYTETESAGLKETIQKVLSKHKSTIESNEDWGKKALAYAIKHKQAAQLEASFVHVVFTAAPAHIPHIEHELSMNETIMRHLLVAVEDVSNEEKPANKKTSKVAKEVAKKEKEEEKVAAPEAA
jgi:small subunit ribosomal protein S6